MSYIKRAKRLLFRVILVLAVPLLLIAATQPLPDVSRDSNGVLRPAALKSKVASARLFARSLVGEKREGYLQSFMFAYNAAGEVEKERNSSWAGSIEKWDTGDPLLSVKSYLDRQREQIEDLISPATLGALDAQECVALTSGSSAGYSTCCSGVLVGKKSVLTAAHCLRPAVCGEWVEIVNSSGGAASFKVASSLPHDNLDLAILTLDGEAKLKPVAVSDTALIDKAPYVEAVGFGSGGGIGGGACGGLTGIRQHSSLPILEPCDSTLETKIGVVCRKGQFLAGSAMKGVCPGDSGGGGFVDSGGVRRLAGIVIEKVREDAYIGRFQRVDGEVGDWLKANIK